MARRAEEFYCSLAGSGCGGYFLSYLREDMSGNFTIRCPSCGHEHFRVIKDGLITDDRHNQRLGETTVIVGLKSTFRMTPYHNDPAYRRSLLQVFSGGQQ